MRKRAVTLVVLAGVAAGGAALLLDKDDRRLPSDFQRAVSLTGYSRYDYATDDALNAMRAAAGIGAEWVTITPAWYQPTTGAARVAPEKWRTPAPESVDRIMREARKLGLKVTLKPHLNSLDGTYRGEIAPRDVARWFASYSRMIRRYADMAERAGASQLVVGTELEGVTHHERRWRALIETARDHFSGRLTYAANYDEVFRIEFWDALDLIGVDAYFPLGKGDDASVSDLIEAWAKPLGQLKRVQRRWNKKVLMTEIGYPSADSALETPYEARGAQDLDLQKRAVEAALTAIAEHPWIAGTTWWEWWSRPSKLDEGDTEFALNGKPAADVIEDWYEE